MCWVFEKMQCHYTFKRNENNENNSWKVSMPSHIHCWTCVKNHMAKTVKLKTFF
jgi:hypothetical protein